MTRVSSLLCEERPYCCMRCSSKGRGFHRPEASGLPASAWCVTDCARRHGHRILPSPETVVRLQVLFGKKARAPSSYSTRYSLTRLRSAGQSPHSAHLLASRRAYTYPLALLLVGLSAALARVVAVPPVVALARAVPILAVAARIPSRFPVGARMQCARAFPRPRQFRPAR